MLLQGNSWRLRFDGLSLRFWQKTNSFATLTHVFFSQTSTRVHQILIPTHNHEVTPYGQNVVSNICHCHSHIIVDLVIQVHEELTLDQFKGNLPIIKTADVQRGLDYFNPWLQPDNKQPFILVGPEGCGKG